MRLFDEPFRGVASPDADADTTDFAARYDAASLQSDIRDWRDCDYLPGTSTCSSRVLPTNGDSIAQDNEIGPSNNARFGAAPARRADPDIKRVNNLEFSVGVDRQIFWDLRSERPGIDAPGTTWSGRTICSSLRPIPRRSTWRQASPKLVANLRAEAGARIIEGVGAAQRGRRSGWHTGRPLLCVNRRD